MTEKFPINEKHAQQIGAALQLMQEGFAKFVEAMAVVIPLLAEAGVKFNTDLEVDEDDGDEPTVAVVEVPRPVKIGDEMYIEPKKPYECAVIQYPGGRVLYGPTPHIRDLDKVSMKYSPESVRFVYRRGEKQPWNYLTKVEA